MQSTFIWHISTVFSVQSCLALSSSSHCLQIRDSISHFDCYYYGFRVFELKRLCCSILVCACVCAQPTLTSPKEMTSQSKIQLFDCIWYLLLCVLLFCLMLSENLFFLCAQFAMNTAHGVQCSHCNWCTSSSLLLLFRYGTNSMNKHINHIKHDFIL